MLLFLSPPLIPHFEVSRNLVKLHNYHHNHHCASHITLTIICTAHVMVMVMLCDDNDDDDNEDNADDKDDGAYRPAQ